MHDSSSSSVLVSSIVENWTEVWLFIGAELVIVDVRPNPNMLLAIESYYYCIASRDYLLQKKQMSLSVYYDKSIKVYSTVYNSYSSINISSSVDSSQDSYYIYYFITLSTFSGSIYIYLSSKWFMIYRVYLPTANYWSRHRGHHHSTITASTLLRLLLATTAYYLLSTTTSTSSLLIVNY